MRRAPDSPDVRRLRASDRRGVGRALLAAAPAEARGLEPEIPATGLDGIPVRHELEPGVRLGGGREAAAADTWQIEREEAR